MSPSSAAPDPHVFAVILAGGSGTRFWPLSRKARPKQLLSLAGAGGPTLIGETVRRVLPLCPPERILISTAESLLAPTRAALPFLSESAFLGEPMARNTAPAVGLAALEARRRDPEALVMVLPSDHDVTDVEAFLGSLRTALRSAASGVITTVGITPTRAESGYGYIALGEALEAGVHRAEGFVEKPDAELAERLVRGGRHLWNSGMFFFRAETLLGAFQEHAPAIFEGLSRIERALSGARDHLDRVTREVFSGLTAISLDHAVMEKVTPLHVVPASFGWSDLGSWQSAWEFLPKDARGNSRVEHALYVDAEDNLVVDDSSSPGSGGVIALVGVSDLCVVKTDDGLLVMKKSHAQEVRQVVEALEKSGRRDRT